MTAEAAPTTELAAYRRRLTGGWDELTSLGSGADQSLIRNAVDAMGLSGLIGARQEMDRLVEVR